MGKFKIGDRVRRVKGTCFGGAHGEGFVGDVTAIDEYGAVLIFTNGHRGFADQYELVDGSPVRERTVKEIVSGDYGRLRVLSLKGVSDIQVGVRFISSDSANLASLTSAELTAAIATLTTIRDALDEVA